MTGFISGDPIDSPGVDAAGVSEIPATTGQVVGAAAAEAFESGPTPRLLRQAERVGAPDVSVPADPRIPPSVFGDPTTASVDTPMAPPPKIDADEANAKYGIKGPTPDTSLAFKAPITDQAAADLYNHQRAENLRMDTLSRAQAGILTSSPAKVVYSLAGGALDPSNLAMALIPGIGEANEARIATQLGGGIVGRAAGRVVAGAVAGAGQMAALEPLNYGLDTAEGKEWSIGDAARNIAWGTALGGGLHVIGGTIKDALGRTVPTAPIPAAIDRMDPEAQLQLVRGAIAQAMDDRAVNVRPAFDLFQAKVADRAEPIPDDSAPIAGQEVTTTPPETDAESATPSILGGGQSVESVKSVSPDITPETAQGGQEASIDNVPVNPDRTPLYDTAEEPERLTSYVERMGGVVDEGGNVRAILGDNNARPGLINENGLSLDEMTEKAWQAGYFPEHGDQRPMINDLLEAIDDDYNSYEPRYTHAEENQAERFREAQDHNNQVNRLADTYGIDTRGKTRAQFYGEVDAAASRELVNVANAPMSLEDTFDVRSADHAAQTEKPAKPSDALTKVQRQIADVEAAMFPQRAAEADARPGDPTIGGEGPATEPAQTGPVDPDVAAAQALVDTAEKRAAGLDAIAACPGVIGA